MRKASPVIGQFLLRMKLLESLKIRKEKNSKIKVINIEWRDQVFLCGKGSQLRTVHMIQRCLKSVIKQKFQDFRCIS